MDEEGEGSLVCKSPDCRVIPLSLSEKSREEVRTTSNQLVTKGATENGLNTATQLAVESHKVGNKTGIRLGDPEAATCMPTIPGSSPSEAVPEPAPSTVTSTYIDEAGIGPGYEHPFWTLLYEAGYRQW